MKHISPSPVLLMITTDNLISSGANIMVEIVRQAMIDLCKLLRERNLSIPHNLWLQFDNYVSLLNAAKQ